MVETGTAAGGSSLFLADMCELLDKGRVVSIDVAHPPALPKHRRLVYLTVSSVDPDTRARLGAMLRPGERGLVILDPLHESGHVAEELRLYADLVAVGSYLVVEDTNLGGNPVHTDHPPDFGPGPTEAVRRFLAGDPALRGRPAARALRRHLQSRRLPSPRAMTSSGAAHRGGSAGPANLRGSACMTGHPAPPAAARRRASRPTDAPANRSRGAASTVLMGAPSFLLRRAIVRAHEIHAEEVGPDGPTPQQYAVIVALGLEPGLTQAQISEITGIDRSTLGEILDRMAARGLVERGRVAGDRRAHSLRLTAAGEKHGRDALPAVARAQVRMLEPLPAEDRARALALIALLGNPAPRTR